VHFTVLRFRPAVLSFASLAVLATLVFQTAGLAQTAMDGISSG